MDISISIPSYTTSPLPSPHTVYVLAVRLGLRSYSLSKRFSDFVRLADELERAVGEPIPFKLPHKRLFRNDAPALLDDRREKLEAFLRELVASSDSRWRRADAFREFLNIPQQAQGPQPAQHKYVDPNTWLDTLAETKSLLHEARRYLADRALAQSAETSAQAKKCLVQTGANLVLLDRGLKDLASSIGPGELRRRTDMVSLLRKERDGLESLAATISRAKHQQPLGRQDDDGDDDPARSALFDSVASSAKRVLGPLRESSETRQLDNKGLLELQMKKMQEQDDALLEFSKILARQRQLGIDINDELELQGEMLRFLSDDVDNSDGKLKRADRKLRSVQ